MSADTKQRRLPEILADLRRLGVGFAPDPKLGAMTAEEREDAALQIVKGKKELKEVEEAVKLG